MTRVLVLNAGSSSLKVSVIEAGRDEPLARAQAAWGSDATRVANRRSALEQALAEVAARGVAASTLQVAAHRVVHGGARFREPVLVDDSVLTELDELTDLAPLHNSVALDTLRAQRELLPDLPAIATFDTSFHSLLPEDAYVYPLPWEWHAAWGVRRYGFHGLSVAWSVRRAGALLGRRPDELSLVVAHLGSGCSVTAVAAGRSVSTSMGLTPLEGLAMGTRSGSVDPGVLLYALRERGLTADDLAETLDHGSGLLGLSGVSGDMREVSEAAANGSARARLAIAVFVRRAAEGIAAAATSLERLDALVFTGGIGEHSGQIRSAVAARLAALGVPRVSDDEIDEDRVLATSGGGVSVLRIEAREDIVMASAAAGLVGSRG